MPASTIRQLPAIERKISETSGRCLRAKNSGVSSSERRMTRMIGTIRHPMKKGMRQPHCAIAAAGINFARPNPIEAATTIATCWLADCHAT